MYLFLHRKSRGIDPSLHKVIDNKYTHAYTILTMDMHTFPLFFTLFCLTHYKDKQRFQKSWMFSFFPTQVLPYNPVKFLDFLLLEKFLKELKKVTETQAPSDSTRQTFVILHCANNKKKLFVERKALK